MYRDMNANTPPYTKNHTPSSQFYYPNWESFPPQMSENQTNTSQNHEHWPHNHSYPVPIPCQNCCNHGQPPSYYNFRPPYPNYTLPPGPPPYGYYYGGYPPAYPQPYPYVPPPHYPMEMPRYDYDQGLSKGFHCCECPNHSHVKSMNSVKIEEHDPDEESKKVESLVPAGVSSSPYPVKWVPPEYMMSKEYPRRMVEREMGEGGLPPLKKPNQSIQAAKQNLNDGYQWFPLDMNTIRRIMEDGGVMKPNDEQKKGGDEIREKKALDVEQKDQNNQSIQAVGQDPNARYQWFPVDVNSIRKLMEGGDVMKPHEQEKKGEDGKKAVDLGKKELNDGQFSYPIVWMPYDGKREGIKGKAVPAKEQAERNNGKRPVDEHPSTFKVSKHPNNEPVTERSAAGENASGARSRESHKPSNNVRVIPVKQLDDSAAKSVEKEDDSKVNGNLKNVEKIANRDSAKNVTEKKPSVPTKKSKLPPICLRVDPPKKKNGNGSTRPHSPPAEKKRQELGDSKEESKDKELWNSKEEIQVKEVVKNASDVNDAATSRVPKEEENRSCIRERQSEVEEKPTKHSDSMNSDGVKCGGDGLLHAPEPHGLKEGNHEETCAPVKKILSREEASVIIQSAYRAYVVRRWEPLKKLKQIANVREEAGKIKSQIEQLESCVTVDNKKKIAIGETIMNLLLKLDTIQGLHPSVRDVRKATAKQLIMLQEKLDCIVAEKSISSGPDSSTTQGLETVRDASKFPQQREASDADQTAEAQREDSVSWSLADQDVKEEVFEVNKEPGREAHNEDIEPPIEVSSDHDRAASCSEINEEELDKTATTPVDSSMESQDPLPDTSPSGDDQDKVGEANVVAGFPLEVEEPVENDIYRMDWECDLGAAKITHGIDQEAPQLEKFSQEIEEQVDGNGLSAFDEEAVEEKHVQADLHGEVDKGDQGETYKVENSETCNKDLEVDQHNDNAEDKCDDFVAIEHDHNILADTRDFTGLESQTVDHLECIQIPILEQSDQVQERTADEVPHVVDQPNDKTEALYDDLLDTETEHHTIAESCDEVKQEALKSVVTDTLECTEIPILEQGDLLNKPIAEEETPVHVVEKEVIKEGPETNCDEPLEEETNGSASKSNLLTLSEGVKEERNTMLSSSLSIDAQQHKDVREASSLSSGGEHADLMERRIIEENDKLRNMLEKLLASGKEQEDVISNLTAKVDDLEKKLSKRRKTRSHKRPGVILSRSKSVDAR